MYPPDGGYQGLRDAVRCGSTQSIGDALIKTFCRRLDSLGNTFDHIIVDSAPTLAVSDALVLSNHASGVVYVIKSDITPYPMAQEGLKRLRQTNAHLIGGVLNEVESVKGRKGYNAYGKYGYYTGNYYGSYGYTTD